MVALSTGGDPTFEGLKPNQAKGMDKFMKPSVKEELNAEGHGCQELVISERCGDDVQ